MGQTAGRRRDTLVAMSDPHGRFAEALLAVEAELDWAALERVYCHGEGAGFFAPGQIEAMRETGLLLADDLARAMGSLPPGAPRRSLYVGAGVAELVPLVCESVVLGREVLLVALPGTELEALARAFQGVAERLGAPLPRVTGTPLAQVPIAPASHAWIVSVLTDPDSFPALHDALYERSGEDATGRGDREQELERARGLIRSSLAHLRPPAILSTTDEELGLVSAVCAEQGLRLEVPPRARLSGVVGDPVRICRLLAGGPGSSRAQG